MRLDKFLKVSRLIKRRTVAKDICAGEKVSVNGRLAKPSAEIRPGDLIMIDMKRHILEVKVLQVLPSVKAEEAPTLYEVLRDENKGE
ncbi:MAG: hypothetical protein AWM53_01352 [Candidatus Dichloromethanomonas elyunquensis]|nr:MAG: hypothetical protein AWM53_01352 [Candidatus Dichloromethanomonas elyunquensis]